MKNTKNNGTVIIGGGLAGTVLALAAYEKQINFKLVHCPNPHSASQVAAGLWNAVSFKRIGVVPHAIEQTKALQRFFSHWQDEFSEPFYFPLASKKIIPTAEYHNDWDAKSTQEPASHFLGDIRKIDAFKHPDIKSQTDYWADVKQGGYLNVPLFLQLAHVFLEEKGILETVEHAHNQRYFTSDTLVVFAEGIQITENPAFNYLPLVPTHGDILRISLDQDHEEILHFGKFLIPLGQKTYRYGSTYQRELSHQNPSLSGLEELQMHWEKYFNNGFSILEHKAGLRPAVRDRMPLLGRHPEYENLYCFNGLGSKGVFMSPWLAEQFWAFLLENKPLQREIDIKRFQKLWKK